MGKMQQQEENAAMMQFGYFHAFMILASSYMQFGIYSKPRNINKLEFCTCEELTKGMRERIVVWKHITPASFLQQLSMIIVG